MNVQLRIVSSIVILVVLICFAMFLKKVGLFEEQEGKVFSRLITNVTLPALIFGSLARTELYWDDSLLPVVMIGATLVCLALGWVVGRALRLKGTQLGPVVLVAGFGSSSLLGFALIREVFPGNDHILAEAAIISGLGVQPILFTVGTLIALYYGDQRDFAEHPYRSALRYFRSPIFLSMIAGIAAIFLHFHANPIFKSVMDGLNVVGSANTFMVTLAVGLLLEFSGLRDVARTGVGVGVVKLVLMPTLLWVSAVTLKLPSWQVHVLVIQGSMPSAMLAVVLASAYGCDGKLASKLVLATTVPSIITVPVLFALLH
jgi:malate permease and related proteins